MLDEIEPYYTDAEVARQLDPTGTRIRARSIRSEREAGRLVGTRVAGKWMYRRSDVLNFLEAARKCREPTADPTLSPFVKGDGQKASSTSPIPREGEASGSRREFLPPILTRRRPISEAGSSTELEHREPAQ